MNLETDRAMYRDELEKERTAHRQTTENNADVIDGQDARARKLQQDRTELAAKCSKLDEIAGNLINDNTQLKAQVYDLMKLNERSE